MTNTQLKQIIAKEIKRLGEYEIIVAVNTGDGCYHEEGTPIYNTVDVYDVENDEIVHSEWFGTEDLFDTAEGYRILRKEQKAKLTYLKKHFENVRGAEFTV